MPLLNGNPTAAELDAAIQGRRAYEAALTDGKDDAEALEIAKQHMRDYRSKQFLRSLGVDA